MMEIFDIPKKVMRICEDGFKYRTGGCRIEKDILRFELLVRLEHKYHRLISSLKKICLLNNSVFPIFLILFDIFQMLHLSLHLFQTFAPGVQ